MYIVLDSYKILLFNDLWVIEHHSLFCGYEKPMTYFPFLLVMVNMNIALRTKHNVMVCTYSLLIIKKVATQTRGASLNVTILQIYLCLGTLFKFIMVQIYLT